MLQDDLKQAIGKRVHAVRTQRHYTQTQFAEAIDISVNFLSEIENGKKGMSQETIYKLCTRFALSADYIVLGKESVPMPNAPDADKLIALASGLSPADLDSVVEYLTSLKKVRGIKQGT